MEFRITRKKISDRERKVQKEESQSRTVHVAMEGGSPDSRNHTAEETTSGTCVGEKARSMRTAMISTGRKRRRSGGGGSGGRNKGKNSKERVRNTITAIDLAL